MSKSEAQVLDFEKICRLCLLEKRSMSSIFTKKKSDKKVPLPVRIMSCASLELYEGDGLPASICSKCLLSVNQSYAFREQCEQADTTLRQYAQRMNEPSGETSSNREFRERIAIDSLGRVEEMGIKIEECNDHEDKDFEQSDNSDLNSEKFAKSSVGNLEETGNVRYNIITKKTFLEGDASRNTFKKENPSLAEKSAGEVVTITSGESNYDEPELNRFLVGKESAVDVQIKVTSEDFRTRDDNVTGSFEKRDSSSPLMKALSEEKAEDLVVMADIPAILENEDCDFGETGIENDNSLKSKTHKWVRHGFRSKRQLLFSQLLGKEKFLERKSFKENSSKRNSFENKKHLELLQNLMKNKSIIVQKRVACASADILAEKIFTLKNQEFNKILCRQKGLTFPYDFKIAQLWKEWEEVNKRIPKILDSKAINSDLPDMNKDNAAVLACKELSDDFVGCERDEDFSESAFVERFRDQESRENSKAKWKNAKETVYCKECRIFLLRSSYSNHIKFVHKKIRQYLCKTCGYAACTGTILRQHVQAVHVGYSFFCDQCPKKFNLIKRLRKHVESHHSGKPIERNQICQYCGMAFVKPGCLKRHLRSHTQETPYECQYCQRRFKYRWPKVQHERLHTGEKPYKCTFCEERFTQNCVRKAHEYKKHGNEEFKPKIRVGEENATSQKVKKRKRRL